MTDSDKPESDDFELLDRTPQKVVVTPAQRRFSDWMTDILIYTVVLNLFVEHVDAIVIDSFSISVLTAVLLKVMLAVVTGVEHRVHHFFASIGTPGAKVAGSISIVAILVGGKLLILEVVDIVFGEHVELGHFFEIMALIIAMIAAREVFNRFYARLGAA